MIDPRKLFVVDLPPRSGIEAFIELGPLGPNSVRFRAFRPRVRVLPFLGRVYSAWSGWFPYDGEPIRLQWDVFW